MFYDVGNAYRLLWKKNTECKDCFLCKKTTQVHSKLIFDSSNHSKTNQVGIFQCSGLFSTKFSLYYTVIIRSLHWSSARKHKQGISS